MKKTVLERLMHVDTFLAISRSLLAAVICSTVICSSLVCSSLHAESGFSNFITARDGHLMDGDQPFRFISFNIPNLSYTEDNMQFDQTSGFRLPAQFEIDDALA